MPSRVVAYLTSALASGASLFWHDRPCLGPGAKKVSILGAEVAAQADIIRRQAEALVHQKKIIDRSSAQAKIGVWECDLSDGSLTWTDGTYDLFELPHGSPIAREQILRFYDPDSEVALTAVRDKAIAERSSFDLDVRIRTAGGHERWIRITASVECDQGRPVRLFGMKQDVTEQKRLMDRLRHLAERDPLTDLANRSRFDQVLADALKSGVGSLLLVDLDGFKQINDAHGHAVGDECLKQVAARLRRVFSQFGLVARLGGDEFAVIVRQPISVRTLEIQAALFLVAMTRPMVAEGLTLHPSASVGCAPFDGRSALDNSTIYIEADLALYAAKADGKKTYRIYSNDLHIEPGSPTSERQPVARSARAA